MTFLKQKIIMILFITALPVLLVGQYKSYGNDLMNLVKGPLGEIYGGVSGLISAGSENVYWNPLNLINEDEKDMYFYHSIWFTNSLSATSMAYTYNRQDASPIALMLSKVGVDNIADSRSALLDYGADGIPGTLDEGENNGQLDYGERLNYDNVKFVGTASYLVSVSSRVELFKQNLGISGHFIYQDLIATTGYGLAFDLFLEKKGKRIQSLYKLSNIPSAASFFDNGGVEFYTPQLEANWALPLSLKGIILTPGLSLQYFIGEERNDLISIGEIGSLSSIPSIYLEFPGKFSIGSAWHQESSWMLNTNLNFKSFDIQYTFRGIQENLGYSHLFALKFSLKSLFEE